MHRLKLYTQTLVSLMLKSMFVYMHGHTKKCRHTSVHTQREEGGPGNTSDVNSGHLIAVMLGYFDFILYLYNKQISGKVSFSEVSHKPSIVNIQLMLQSTDISHAPYYLSLTFHPQSSRPSSIWHLSPSQSQSSRPDQITHTVP